MAKFSFRSKDFGLTYPEAANVEKAQLFEGLYNLVIRGAKVDMLMVSEEVGHQSGRRHFHVYIRFNKKITCDEKSFDVCGLHCHIQKVIRDGGKTIYPMLKYLAKEDQFPIATFDWKDIIEKKEEKEKKNKQPDWISYQNEDLTQDEVFERLALDGFSSQLANHFLNWSQYIKKTFKAKNKEVYIPAFIGDDFKLPEELVMWKFAFMGWIELFNCKKEWSRPNSLILIGPSRTGKTEWARSLGHHMYFNNLLNLDDWDESADYIVLDDFSPEITKFLPSWKCFFGGQKQFTLTDKYRGKRTVHWGKPMIWLSNEDIFKHLNLEQGDFIRKNCTIVCLNNKLY